VGLREASFLALLLLSGDVSATEKCETTLLIGDSLAVGVAPRLAELAENSGGSLVTAAVVGTNTCQWRGKVWPLVVKHRPSKVIIILGTNDAMVSGWAKKNADCYGDIINETLGTQVFWILPPPMPFVIQRNIPDVRKAIAAAKVKIYDGITDGDIPRSGDGVHMPMGVAGYDKWADRIAVWLKKNSS